MKQYWLGIFNHRFGSDYALFKKKPTFEQLAKFWQNEHEPERGMDNESGPQDEYFEIEQVTLVD